MKKLNEDINRLRKLMNLTEYSTVSDVYDNVDFKDGAVGNSKPSRDGINPVLLQDVQTAAKNAGIKVDITTAVSGHRPGSRHEHGNAVDIAIINGKAVRTSNRADADKLVGELIKMGYVKNREVGNPKAVLTFGFPKHDDHVHISNTSNSPTKSSDTNVGQDVSVEKSDSGGEEKVDNSTTKSSDKKGTVKKTPDGKGYFDSFIGTMIKSALPYLGEGKIYDDFGRNTKISYNEILIPKKNNKKIESPISGKIENYTYNSRCANQLCVKHKIDGETYYLEYCGIDNPDVSSGYGVNVGTILGTTESDVTVTLYNKNGRKQSIEEFINKKSSSDDDSKIMPVVVPSKGNKPKNKPETPSDDDDTPPKKYKPEKKYYDPLTMGILTLPQKILSKVFSSGFKSVTKK